MLVCCAINHIKTLTHSCGFLLGSSGTGQGLGAELGFALVASLWPPQHIHVVSSQLHTGLISTTSGTNHVPKALWKQCWKLLKIQIPLLAFQKQCGEEQSSIKNIILCGLKWIYPFLQTNIDQHGNSKFNTALEWQHLEIFKMFCPCHNSSCKEIMCHKEEMDKMKHTVFLKLI